MQRPFMLGVEAEAQKFTFITNNSHSYRVCLATSVLERILFNTVLQRVLVNRGLEAMARVPCLCMVQGQPLPTHPPGPHAKVQP